MKKCRKCEAQKPVDCFYAGDSSCKECRKRLVTAYRNSNLEKVREYDSRRARLPDRKAHIRATTDKWRRDHPDRYKAETAVGNAVRDGRLRKQPCEVCGDEKVHGHHDDYSRPLNVRWLCPVHHAVETRKSR